MLEIISDRGYLSFTRILFTQLPQNICGIWDSSYLYLLWFQLSDTVQDFAQFKRQEPGGPSVRGAGSAARQAPVVSGEFHMSKNPGVTSVLNRLLSLQLLIPF